MYISHGNDDISMYGVCVFGGNMNSTNQKFIFGENDHMMKRIEDSSIIEQPVVSEQ